MDLVDPNSSHAQEFKKTVSDINREACVPNLADYFPLRKRIDPQGLRRRMTVYFGKLIVPFGNMFDERLESRKSKGSTASNDVLDTLIDIVEDGLEKLNRTQVVQLLLVLFVAGTDTTSNTTEWAMAELLLNPRVFTQSQRGTRTSNRYEFWAHSVRWWTSNMPGVTFGEPNAALDDRFSYKLLDWELEGGNIDMEERLRWRNLD
ncbi:Detected protein of unknown function [Hibiscus syriacus]|uniref:Uncharacterized protein n=1 Tax=Hibiscus syriacus TaxID=106335 RepID=A0A6A2Z9S1_HIBSY|nr:Detected protein of unknown function [Hibiscus syriacus]